MGGLPPEVVLNAMLIYERGVPPAPRFCIVVNAARGGGRLAILQKYYSSTTDSAVVTV